MALEIRLIADEDLPSTDGKTLLALGMVWIGAAVDEDGRSAGLYDCSGGPEKGILLGKGPDRRSRVPWRFRRNIEVDFRWAGEQ
jgi:hypothetical protein